MDRGGRSGSTATASGPDANRGQRMKSRPKRAEISTVVVSAFFGWRGRRAPDCSDAAGFQTLAGTAADDRRRASRPGRGSRRGRSMGSSTMGRRSHSGVEGIPQGRDTPGSGHVRARSRNRASLSDAFACLVPPASGSRVWAMRTFAFPAEATFAAATVSGFTFGRLVADLCGAATRGPASGGWCRHGPGRGPGRSVRAALVVIGTGLGSSQLRDGDLRERNGGARPHHFEEVTDSRPISWRGSPGARPGGNPPSGPPWSGARA